MWNKGMVILVLMLLAAACSSTEEPALHTPGSTAATTTAQPATTTTTTTTTSVPTTTTTRAQTSTTTFAMTTTTAGQLGGLPGWDTWTLVFASLETVAYSEEDAAGIAATIDDAKVLRSDDYPSLNPGYWVVHAGTWGERRAAGGWCPRPLDPGLSCYPRYLGPRVADLLGDGAAVAQISGKLVVLDPFTGEVLANLSDFFHEEAAFPSRFALNRGDAELYFALGFEDSWYSCESDKGEIRRLDLAAGTEEVVADGWSPAISPDGRWLAVVAAAECYPDPDTGGWVITPGSQVEVFDLASDSFSPSYLFRPTVAPTSYESLTQVHAVFWEADSAGLLVALGDNTVRSISLTGDPALDQAPVVFETGEPFLAAVSPTHYYFTSYADSESILITTVDRATTEVTSMRQVDGYWTGIAVSDEGEVLIGSAGLLMLPSGVEVAIDGDVSNIDW